jgi:hypothetical protein
MFCLVAAYIRHDASDTAVHVTWALQLKIWRQRQHLTLPVTLSTPHQLVPVHSHDIKPSYFIYGGLVFTPLTSWYLRSLYGTDWSCKAPIKLVEKAFAASMKQKGEEVVVLSKVSRARSCCTYYSTCNGMAF